MYRTLQKEAIKSLENAISSLGYEVSEIKVEEPPNPNMGDLASTVAFQLAKVAKKPPIEIAKDMLNNIEVSELFQSVEMKGPYINFFVDNKNYSRKVLESIDDNYGQLESKDKKVILEHTSANPNGPLHIGHIRNSVIGDSLSRVLKSAGYNVETQYYVNDMGRQIAIIAWGLLNFDYKIEKKEKVDHEIGKIYFQINEKLRADESLTAKVSELLKIYESGANKELEDTFHEIVSKCLDGIKVTTSRLNILHDVYVWESKFIKDGTVRRILNDLKGHTKTNEVLYLPLEDYGIEKELILTRSDGTSLYSTRDIAYHLEKSENSDEVVDVLGSDHKLAIDQLSVVLELMGGKPPEVIFYEFITLPEGSMSTRRGVFISVDELIEEAISRALDEIKKRREDLDDDSALAIAEDIGIGAIRYFIAKLSPEKHIVFKWDEALSFERGCASIQYAHARACKLLEKASFSPQKVDLDGSKLNEEAEIELIKLLSKFTSVVEESARINRVHPVAQYAMDLAGAFNRFYKSVPVIGADEEITRLLIVDKSRITIKNCLKLLGINAPTSM
ncbi:arginine--tRNA ligase [Methanobacterium sp. ACI-7]|uniref:arginine--tRNA ligase n=1 Tax=unclassified Methanobacterium TaxID=2627676 RepID=UPI0039C033E3